MNREEENILSDIIKNQINDIPIILNDELTYNAKKFEQRTELKIITNHVDDFINGKYFDRYIILPGLRGVGKTTLLFQLYDYLLNTKQQNQDQILYLSCEDLKKSINIELSQAIEYFLKEYHNTNLRLLNKNIFLLIDEAHFYENWSLSGKTIYDKSKKIFMIFTGSSAIKIDYKNEGSRRILKYLVSPLNYSQYLKLKFNYSTGNISNELSNLIFNGNIEKAKSLEFKIKKDLVNLKDYSSMEWNNYFKYGGFPISLFDDNTRNIQKRLYSTIDDIIEKDLKTMKNISKNSEYYAFRLINFLAQKLPGDVSQNTLSDLIKASSGTVNTILKLLEKTQLLFHLEPYSDPNARTKKSWEYYFATASLRHAINKKWGFSSMKEDEYEGMLLENLIASGLFNLKNNENHFNFHIYFDPLKGGVDFLVKKGLEKPIPIEVGRGNKKNKQIIRAINNYDADYGVIISDTTKSIEKKDNIIYLPYKTFSLM